MTLRGCSFVQSSLCDAQDDFCGEELVNHIGISKRWLDHLAHCLTEATCAKSSTHSRHRRDRQPIYSSAMIANGGKWCVEAYVRK